ncbi:MAG: tetratricopeptide repeat protein [Gammaproteobacteria bacterium]|nr:tetratricopeptide repeat protein [Gammaproteobacteria bacterium]
MNAGSNRESGDTPRAADYVWRFGNVELDGRSLGLVVGGQPMAIEPKPLTLLLYFLTHPGEAITKDELLEAMWPGRIVVEAALTNCVHKLRSLIGDDQATVIQTVRGYGYRLVVADLKVEKLAGSAPPQMLAPTMKAGETVHGRPLWELQRCLGSSGYGEVWLARHSKLRELRVFKFAHPNATSLAAIKREITLHRLMRNVLGHCEWLVNVLDWNLTEPPYFIEIEYVRSGSITDWAKSHGGIDKVALTLRLGLIVQAAEALATAHSMGVLHKDLKPANLLVDTSDPEHPRLLLSDFGSGRLLDDERLGALNITRLGFTHTALRSDTDSGTLLYMAPEILGGEPATIQADVYALGVILYQMVAGDLGKPLAPGWEQDIEDELLREDIARAVAGNPEQRLASVTELADRLERLAERRAEREHERRRAEDMEKTRAALTRARARRGLLQALVATFLIAAVVTGILLWQTQRERTTAEREARLAQSVTHFLTNDLLSSANPMIAGSRDVTVRQVLDAASAKLDTQFARQPLVKASLERVIGTAYAAMGDRKQAVPLLLAAEHGLSAQLGNAAPETEAARLALRDLYLDLFDIKGVLAVSKRMDAAEQAAGIPNPEAEYEARAMLIAMPAIARAGAYWLTDLQAPMNRLYQEAKKQLGPDNRATTRMLWYRGVALSWAHRYREAVPIHREVLEKFRKIYGHDHPRTLEAAMYLAQALDRTGRAAEARPLLEKMTADFEHTLGANHVFLLNTRRTLAENNLLVGKPRAAIKEMRAVYARRKALLGENSRLAESDALYLAKILAATGRPAEALPILERLLRSQEDGQGATSPQTLLTRNTLGKVLAQMHRDGEAQALLSKNYRSAAARLHSGWFLGETEYELGNVLKAEGKSAQAKPLLEKAATVFTQALGTQDPMTKKARLALADF